MFYERFQVDTCLQIPSQIQAKEKGMYLSLEGAAFINSMHKLVHNLYEVSKVRKEDSFKYFEIYEMGEGSNSRSS